GQSQFMPSSFVNYAIDYDGDGRRNIWTSRADVFASTANYLKQIGWRDDQTWGREVRVPPGLDAKEYPGTKLLQEWERLGVRRTDGTVFPGRALNAQLVQPDGPGGRSFLAYDNYRGILKWNRSTFFALAVGLLADQIDGG
ncbi:MAG: lytic murein transglycosylase, partial [Alphaproteobacteria bacterium]|nr:lytic murein transglycosylase [Alphaproteobacteria bacterium]